ncbi:PolC-type DNA polymerase III [Mycoplasmopsis anatis]|uniref:PolC-type DNA polymerase III n=1 Tax=Mycoplasmopsis anatis TaxID=171279 RepID=UPI000DC71ABA|nr:PolC-type DNA polymerase III [Mycoplasmopsis anatis]AWX70137.1 PolC-type DNA polymerase III [Mycoplasmopsis anatis]VEU73421.1 DNA polymerase III polC-type [Mycoplasmopsis anatis]
MNFYRDNHLASFFKMLNLDDMKSFKDSFIVDDEIIFNENNSGIPVYKFTIGSYSMPSVEDFFTLLLKVSEIKNQIFKIKFHITSKFFEPSEIKKYIIRIHEIYGGLNNLHAYLTKIGEIKSNINNESYIIEVKETINKDQTTKIYEAEIEKVNNFLHKIGLKWFKLILHVNEVIDVDEYNRKMNEKKKEELELFMKKIEETEKKDNLITFNAPKVKFNRPTKNYVKMKINEINSDQSLYNKTDVNTVGEIFNTDYLVSKNGFHIYTFVVTDYNDAIEVKKISKAVIENTPKIGDTIEIFGTIENDFRNRRFIMLDNFVKTSKLFEDKKDIYERKRVELNTRSKMNTMDGILEAKEILDIASKYGHKAVALVDNTSVQNFPKFFYESKKSGVKPIYGVTFNVIHKNNMAVIGNVLDAQLRDVEYVSFDIETTHLSPHIGDIIEFGASIVKDGKIVEKIQFFLKTEQKLSDFTKELTKITDDMLQKQGVEQITGLLRIREILHNKVAVAHNVQFDYNFIFEKLRQNNIELPNTTFIDSLVISRLLFPNKYKHKLENYCSYLGVEYSRDIAHRADYDAEVLANAWRGSFQKLQDLQITSFKELYEYKDNSLYEKTRAANITILALNQQGLKELFELVTFALTDNFYKEPKLFYEDLPRSKNLLIGSSGIQGDLIDSLLYSSKDKIDYYIDLFDYIEIPAPQNLKHKVGYGEFTEEEIQRLLKYLVLRSKQKQKMVVAIGDVRYESKKDLSVYSILVNSKGIGGVSHYLYNYDRDVKLQLPYNDFLTTDEMIQEFKFLNDIKLIEEIVIDNPNKIADLVEEIEVIKKDLYTPKFDDSTIKLPELVYKTAHEIYGEKLPEIVEKRIKKEIEPILKYGFDVVYWISHILVKKSLDNGYLVGSRGSVGSSLVATLSGITEINPLEPHYICENCKHFEIANVPGITSGFDLEAKNCPNCSISMKRDGQSIPFETFLGFNADKVPDIDLNFSGDYQPVIHDEVKRLFGDGHTFRAGTISTIAEKTAYGYIKAVNEEQKLNYSPLFIEFLSKKLEGVKKTTGQHPGGIIIIPKEFSVEDFTPVNYPANDMSSTWKTTHFEYRAIHDNVLKLDILGHVDPMAIKMLERLTGLNVKKDIPVKDENVIGIFSNTKSLGIKPEDIGGEPTGALGIPEFGTGFVRQMLSKANPSSFADLVSLSGLSHGTNVWLNNAHDLIVNEGLTLKDVICCRDDIMIYLMSKGIEPSLSFKVMEQVRKGKSITAEQEKELLSKNVETWYIESMKKIEYMFPKAHATAYVLMAWRIAWFKVYYPLEFYATFFTTRCEAFDLVTMMNDYGANKINNKITEINSKDKKDRSTKEQNLIPTLELAREMYSRGYKISNINIYKSLEIEWVVDKENKALIPPFSVIDGLGYNVAHTIINARNERPFLSVEDFKRRTSVNQTQFKDMQELGIFDELDETDQMRLF